VNIATALIYLLAAVLFIVGLKFLSSPRGARRGNTVAAAGMVLAVAWTVVLLRDQFTVAGIVICVLGVLIGSVAGTVGARRVKMTAMPQMVALFNGVGGGAAALVAVSELLGKAGERPDFQTGFPSAFAIIVGGISFAGSAIAFAKLQELMTGTPITYPGQQVVNGLLAAAIVALVVALLGFTGSPVVFTAMLVLALVLGVAFVLPIGGADMPVVISMLNAFTGLAVAASGFVVDNFALIVAGTLVGASGTLLTKLMGDAMGRSLANVLFGAFGQVQTGAGGAVAADGRSVRAGSSDDIGTMLAYSRSVIIVPGYGLAVAQAQHAVRELADLLEKRGVEVNYAIHPVAGRMPGHMNVLLAEAEVPYDQVFEMEDINGEFAQADVAIILGANDVVNPAALTKGTPIYGMPILEAYKAKTVIVNKRSMAAGYAGLDNELFYMDKTMMVFGDAKKVVEDMVKAVE
jgi:H+-translocating NAD(P) transhydrogenase subunit beta